MHSTPQNELTVVHFDGTISIKVIQRSHVSTPNPPKLEIVNSTVLVSTRPITNPVNRLQPNQDTLNSLIGIQTVAEHVLQV